MDEINQNLDKQVKEKYRYIKIDFDILFNENLSITAKHLFPIIEALDHAELGCFASNEYLAAYLDCSARNISRAISELKEEGYIDTLLVKGKYRTIKIIDSGERKKKINKAIEDKEKRIRDFLVRTDTTKLLKEARQSWLGTDDKNSDIVLKEEDKEHNNKSIEKYVLSKDKTIGKAEVEQASSPLSFSKDSCSARTDNPDQSVSQTEKDKTPDPSPSLRDKFKRNKKKEDLDPLTVAAKNLYKLWQGFGFNIDSTKKDMGVLLDVLNGTFFENPAIQQILETGNERFGETDIQKSITNFNMYCLSNPKTKKRIRLSTFFYDPYNKKVPSSFISNLNPIKKKEPVEKLPVETDEEWPITSTIKGEYQKRILNDVVIDFSLRDEKNFRKARDFVIQFAEKNRNKLIGGMGFPQTLAGALVKAWEEHMEDRLHEMRIGFLACKTAGDVLLKYLMAKGLVKNYQTSRAGF